ncbi:cysteine hydrolase family protein [Acuticoccus kandeliae]|uniref:cysteine hydrolase family protein n=1 Tax=Acuticoccus kandeliae TaxID=2073160 RepID=UPI000D3E901A|nr:isochorismatase family cysteine hydrolase [Acuticoccus kandeliae]
MTAFDPDWLPRAALLIVDMNRSHLDHEMGHLLVAKPDADRIIEAAARLRSAWRAAGLPVIFVRTHHRYDPTTGTVVDNKNPFWQAQHKRPIPGLNRERKTLAIEGATVTEVVPQLAPQPGEHTVFKHRYSPFDNTDLGLLLRNLGTETLVICGVNTNNCVLCSCFEAFNRDLRVVVTPDVCASMNGPDYHEAALKLIEAALGVLVPSDEIIAALPRAAAA